MPRNFRLLPNGEIAFFADREGGSALQIFNQQGRLVRFVAYPNGTGGDVTDIGADSTCYSFTRFVDSTFKEWLAQAAAEQEERAAATEKQETQATSEFAKMPEVLFIKTPSGMEDPPLRDKLQKDLFHLLKQLNGFFGIGYNLIVTNRGEIYPPRFHRGGAQLCGSESGSVASERRPPNSRCVW